jgi:Protein of unknown function (DUF3617)
MLPGDNPGRFGMNRLKIASAVAALGLLLGSASAQAADMPQRKPGHWQMTMTMPMGGSRVVDTCITANDNIAVPQGQTDCTKPQVVMSAGSVSSTVTCTAHGMTQTITSNFSGDFESHYHGEIKMSMQPAMAGMQGFDMTVDAKYIGPDCPPGAISVPH